MRTRTLLRPLIAAFANAVRGFASEPEGRLTVRFLYAIPVLLAFCLLVRIENLAVKFSLAGAGPMGEHAEMILRLLRLGALFSFWGLVLWPRRRPPMMQSRRSRGANVKRMPPR